MTPSLRPLWRRLLLPGKGGLLLASAALLLGASVLEPLWDPDLWWHLAVGEWITESGQVPRQDPFAPPGEAKPWLAHEWLFEVVLSLAHRLGGEPLLVLMPAVAAALTAGFALLRASGRAVAATVAAPVVLVALFPTHEFWTQRPQLFTYLFLSWLLWDLQRYSDGQRKVPWHWAPLVALWANLHGAFVVAALAIFAHLAGAGVQWLGAAQREDRGEDARARLRGLAWLFGAVLLAGLANPRGIHLYGHAFMYASSDWHGVAIRDWLSPDFADPRRIAFALVVLAAFVTAGLTRGGARAADLFLVAGFTLMALRWQRNVPLALIAAAPLCAVWLSAALGLGKREHEAPVRPLLGGLHLGVLGVLAFTFVAVRWPCEDGVCEREGSYPRALISKVRSQGLPEGRGLNHFDWGGYLLWRNPGEPVYIDGRALELDLPRLHTYGRIHRLEPGWEALLEREGVRWVLYPRKAPLTRALLAEGWTSIADDELGVLLAKP